MLSDRKGGWNDGNQPFQEIISAQFLSLVLLPAPIRCERIDEQHRSEEEAAPSHSFVYRSLECCQQWLVRVVGGMVAGAAIFCIYLLVGRYQSPVLGALYRLLTKLRPCIVSRCRPRPLHPSATPAMRKAQGLARGRSRRKQQGGDGPAQQQAAQGPGPAAQHHLQNQNGGGGPGGGGPPQPAPQRRKPTPEEQALTAKNYRLAKELVS